jgi:molecular chaperone IbpA
MTLNNTALAEFKSIHNSAFIGFDEFFRMIKELEKPQTGFPPYDIIKHSEERFGIKLAVAGYSKENISVVLDSGKLTISGSIANKNNLLDYSTGLSTNVPVNYIYKGIAERDFKRVFTLSDTIEVEKVTLSDGMLYVTLKNVIPEHQKPKVFEIE